MNPPLCLLPSPLTGPSVWQEAAARLPGRVITMPAPGSLLQTTDQVLAWFADAIPPDEDVILVPHSNAGLYVPALTTRRRVAGYVFVDAILPPASGAIPVSPEQFYDFIAQKADENGLLPPWTQWWDEDISGLFPSPEVRMRVERDLPRLPLSYFRESLPVAAGWDSLPGAFLAFGDTYADERSEARNRGWPVRTMSGEHLHMLIDPAGVAAAIAALTSTFHA